MRYLTIIETPRIIDVERYCERRLVEERELACRVRLRSELDRLATAVGVGEERVDDDIGVEESGVGQSEAELASRRDVQRIEPAAAESVGAGLLPTQRRTLTSGELLETSRFRLTVRSRCLTRRCLRE